MWGDACPCITCQGAYNFETDQISLALLRDGCFRDHDWKTIRIDVRKVRVFDRDEMPVYWTLDADRTISRVPRYTDAYEWHVHLSHRMSSIAHTFTVTTKDYQGFIALGLFERFLDKTLQKIQSETNPVKKTGVYRGWRLWRLQDNELLPLTRGDAWKLNSEGVVTCDQIPKIFGGAGFYGFHSFQEIMMQERAKYRLSLSGGSDEIHLTVVDGFTTAGVPAPSYVMGSFLAWGKIAKAEKGFRAQYAKPEMIVTPTNQDYELALMGVADRYGMKMVSLDDVPKYPGGFTDGGHLGISAETSKGETTDEAKP